MVLGDGAGTGTPGPDAAGRPPPRSRLFIALWPGPATRAALAAWQRRWTWPAGARPTPAPQLHLTLHFLGLTDDARIPDLLAMIERLGPWPPWPFGPWAGGVWARGLAVAEPLASLPALQRWHARLGDGLHSLGIATEARRFRPHVTLAREAAGAVPPAGAWPVRWTATSPVLVRSAGGYAVIGAGDRRCAT